MNIETETGQPCAGLSDPVHDSQRVFRAVLDAMAHPGRVVAIENLNEVPAPLHKATAAICQSLVDFETPLWVDGTFAASDQAIHHVRFHCGCPVASTPQDACTALLSGTQGLTTFEHFNIGTNEHPDLSTTVIMQVDGLSDDAEGNDGMRLTGPGIESENRLAIAGADAAFWNAVKANAALFPRGIDLILVADAAIACLPRTTQVEA